MTETTAPARKRSPERTRFLADLLAAAIEHDGYGFSFATEWHAPDDDPASWFAVIRDRYSPENPETWRVDLDTMARGLGIIQRAFYATTEDGTETVLHNAETFERLYYGGGCGRDSLLLANRTNGEDGDYDVIDALAVMECALFGRVVFA